MLTEMAKRPRGSSTRCWKERSGNGTIWLHSRDLFRSEEHTSELQSRGHLVPPLFPYTTLFQSVRRTLDSSPRIRWTGPRTLGFMSTGVLGHVERDQCLRRWQSGQEDRQRVVGKSAAGTELSGCIAVISLDRKSTRLNSSHVAISYPHSFPTRRSSNLLDERWIVPPESGGPGHEH